MSLVRLWLTFYISNISLEQDGRIVWILAKSFLVCCRTEMKSIGVLGEKIVCGTKQEVPSGKDPARAIWQVTRLLSHDALSAKSPYQGAASGDEQDFRELIQGWSGSVGFLLWFSHCFQSSPKASRDAAIFQTICASIVTLKTVQANRIVWIEAVVGENLRLSMMKFHLMYLTVFILVITVINWWAKRKLRQDIC